MTTNLDNDKLNEQKEETAVGGLYGWICPVCGRGLSPYTNSCPCTINREITCGTGTAVPQFGTTVSYNAPTANLIEDKSRCNKCVSEYRCPKTMDKEGKCPLYKRDPKDGGFYG